MILLGENHPDLMEKAESPVIIQFQSVSNDEMDSSHCASLSLSMDEVPPLPTLSIDTSALRPENRSLSPFIEALETPTYSYYRMPPLKLENNNSRRSATNNPPNCNFPRPPSRLNHLSFGHSTDSNPYISRANSTDSNYRPFLSEDLQTPDEFPMKRKFSSPQPFLSLNPTANCSSSLGYPPQSKRPHYVTDVQQHPFSNYNLFEDSSTPTANNSSSRFQLPLTFNYPMDSHFHHNPPALHPPLSTEPSILLRSSQAPEYFFHQEETRREFFTIYDQIGEGVGSDVYQVESRLDPYQTVYALKKLKRTIRNIKQQEAAMGELQILYELNQRQCPNIPHLYLAWREDEHIYCLLEYAEHGTIKQLLQYHRQHEFIITLPFVWHLIHNVAQALAFIHDQRLVHLDIKSANLLIDQDVNVKVSDFGLTIEEGKTGDEEGDARYVAKEVLMTSERTFSADIFSFGILLYEIIHTINHSPVLVSSSSSSSSSQSTPEVLPVDGPLWHQLRSGEISLPSDCPISLSMLIHAMMHPTPMLRPTAASLLQLPEVMEVQQHPESYLREWEHVCFAPPRSINRTASYDPSMNQSLSK